MASNEAKIDNDSSDLLKYKKLTKLEKVMFYGQQGGFFIINAMTVRQERGNPITESLLKQAAKYWIKRQPMLQSTVKLESDGNDYFVAINKEIYFNNIDLIESNELNKWRDISHKDLGEFFDANEMLWRLRVVKDTNSNDYTFLFIMLHTVTDSVSSNILARDYLLILGALIENKECAEMNTPIQIEPGNFEELLAKQNLRKDYKSMIQSCDLANLNNEVPKRLAGLNEKSLRFDTFSIDQIRANKLMTALKKNTKGAKLNSVFLLAICLSFKRFNAKNDIKSNNLYYEIAINARKNLNLEDNQLADFVTCLFELINTEQVSLESFWQLAEQKSKHLHSLLENIEEIDQLYKAVIDSLEMDESGQFVCPTVNFCLSNLGIFSQTTNDCPIKIQNQYLIPTIPTNYCLYFSVVTIDKQQHWTVVYYENIISQSLVKSFISEFDQLIDELIKE